MPHRVLIPTPLRPYTGQQDAVEADGATVGDVLASLDARSTASCGGTCTATTASCGTSSTSTSTTTTSGTCSRKRRR